MRGRQRWDAWWLFLWLRKKSNAEIKVREAPAFFSLTTEQRRAVRIPRRKTNGRSEERPPLQLFQKREATAPGRCTWAALRRRTSCIERCCPLDRKSVV